MQQADIMGDCLPRFEAVAEAFAAGFSAGREVGAAVAVWHAGDWVVDLWAGHKDRKREQPWQEDTLACFLWTSNFTGRV